MKNLLNHPHNKAQAAKLQFQTQVIPQKNKLAKNGS